MTDPEAILKKRKGVIDDDIQEVEDEYPPRGSSLDPSKKKKQLETAKPTGTTRREYDDNGMSINSHPTVTTLPAQPATAKPSKAARKRNNLKLLSLQVRRGESMMIMACR